ncbi:MAG: hypothetical protein WC214_05290 [Candidatus Omnitrophota bacterium]
MKKIKLIGISLLCYFVGSLFLGLLIDFYGYSFNITQVWLGPLIIFGWGFNFRNILIFFLISLIIAFFFSLYFFLINKYDKSLVLLIGLLLWIYMGFYINSFSPLL